MLPKLSVKLSRQIKIPFYNEADRHISPGSEDSDNVIVKFRVDVLAPHWLCLSEHNLHGKRAFSDYGASTVGKVSSSLCE